MTGGATTYTYDFIALPASTLIKTVSYSPDLNCGTPVFTLTNTATGQLITFLTYTFDSTTSDIAIFMGTPLKSDVGTYTVDAKFTAPSPGGTFSTSITVIVRNGCDLATLLTTAPTMTPTGTT